MQIWVPGCMREQKVRWGNEHVKFCMVWLIPSKCMLISCRSKICKQPMCKGLGLWHLVLCPWELGTNCQSSCHCDAEGLGKVEIIVHTNISLVQSFTILQILETKALNEENLEPTSVSRIAVELLQCLTPSPPYKQERWLWQMMCEPLVVHRFLRLSNPSSLS